MDYLRIYERLITAAMLRIEITGYGEKHHIWPRSFGGPDEKYNLVKLSGREHFIAHILLAKAFPNTSIVHAPFKMACVNDGRYGKITSRLYEQLRKDHARRVSEDSEANSKKGRPGRKQSEEHKAKRAASRRNNGKGWHSEATKKNISSSLIGKPSGDRKGKPKSESEMAAHLRGVEKRKTNGSYIRTEEMNRATSNAQKGISRPFMPTEARLKIIQEQLICPHCGKKGKFIAMRRWHFDKCKILTNS